MPQRLPSLRSASVLVPLLALSGCSSLLGLDDFTAGGDGGASATGTGPGSTGTDGTTSTTTDATTSTGGAGSTTTASATGGGGAGTGGGGTCDQPEDCPDPGACQSATCLDGACGSVVDDPGSTCDLDGGDSGLCNDAGDCVECIANAQCPPPSGPCVVPRCDAGSCTEASVADQMPCPGGSCDMGVCVLIPQCINNQIDAGETDVDCGGVCPGCDVGDNCNVGGDCQSGFCPGGGDCAACTSDANCQNGFFCDESSGTCRPELQNGSPCADGGQCASGNCPLDDGVCCDQPCNSECQACGDGSCNDVTVGTDPEGDCDDATLCLTGACAAGGSCEVEAELTPCGAATCTNGVETSESVCNGVGQCVSGGSFVCAPFACDATQCFDTCSSNNQCASGLQCSGNTCVAPLCPTAPCVLAGYAYGAALDTLPTDVVVDPASNDPIVVGSYTGVLYTGGPTSAGDLDAFLIRFSAVDGTPSWTKSFGNATRQTGHDVSLSFDDSILYATGTFQTGIDLSGDNINDLTPDGSGQEASWVGSFNLAGSYQGANQVGDAAGTYGQAATVTKGFNSTSALVGGATLGPSGMCGLAAPTAGFMGFTATLQTASCGSGRALRANPDGLDEGIVHLAKGSNFFVGVGSNSDGSLFFGPDEIVESNFLARFGANHVPAWGRYLTLSEPHVDVRNSDSSIVAIGNATGSIVIDGGSNPDVVVSASGVDPVVVRYDGSGNLLASRIFSSAGEQRIVTVRHLPNGDIAIGGYFSGTLDLGNDGGGNAVSFNATARDGFVALLDPNLNLRWGLRFGGAGDQEVVAIDATPAGRLWVAGSFFQSVAAGGVTRSSNGSADMFLYEVAAVPE